MHRYVIVDEVDSALIDNARTPVVISGNVAHDAKLYSIMAQPHKLCIQWLTMVKVTLSDEQHKQAFLMTRGMNMLSSTNSCMNGCRYEYLRFCDIHLLHYLMAALKAQHILQKDVDYVLADGHVVIVDEHSGRAMPGRRWGDSVHQAVEAKEGLDIQQESQTLASITFQNFLGSMKRLLV